MFSYLLLPDDLLIGINGSDCRDLTTAETNALINAFTDNQVCYLDVMRNADSSFTKQTTKVSTISKGQLQSLTYETAKYVGVFFWEVVFHNSCKQSLLNL